MSALHTVAVVFFLVFGSGCGSITFPERPPAIAGIIVGMGPDIPFAGMDETRIWVREDPQDECGIVFATSEAEVGVRPDDSGREREVGDLAIGLQVRVWATNVADSCPGQAGATHIEIIPS